MYLGSGSKSFCLFICFLAYRGQAVQFLSTKVIHTTCTPCVSFLFQFLEVPGRVKRMHGVDLRPFRLDVTANIDPAL